MYNTMEEMMLDNRRGLEKDLRRARKSVRENSLAAYDWATEQAIGNGVGYKLLKGTIAEEYGEEKAKEIEEKASKKFGEIGKAIWEYYKDVETGKLVGYSSEDKWLVRKYGKENR